jgi:hypothetical protein
MIGGYQDRFGNPFRPVAPDVAGNFTATGRMTYQHCVLEIEGLYHGC